MKTTLIDPLGKVEWRSPVVQSNCMEWLTRPDWPGMGGPSWDKEFCQQVIQQFEGDIQRYGSTDFLVEYLRARKARAVAWLLSH